MLIDFEDCQNRVEALVETEEYTNLVNLTKQCNQIYIIGNGGLHYVASHMSTDLTRLVPGKSFYSFIT